LKKKGKLSSYEIVIPSDPEKIQQVEKKAEELARQEGFSEDEMDNLAIAVTEVVANAISHGNRNDPSKHVYIKFVLKNGTMDVHIRDEGSGFEPGEVANPLAPENLLKESGRGIFIVKTLMDDVRYRFTKDGTEVILTLKHKKRINKCSR